MINTILFIQDGVQAAGQAAMNSANQVAEASTAAAGADTGKLSILNMAVSGGWIMIVLAVLLVLALYISIERYLALRNALKEDPFKENYYQKYDIFKIDKTMQQCQVISRPRRVADNFWEVEVRLIDNDYSTTLD